MIHIEAYRHERHYADLESWWIAHGQDPIPEDLLPAMGFVIPKVCAGFLYQTDSNLALLEGYISNPETTAQVRDEALDALTETLCSEALKLGYQSVIAFTQAPPVVSRASRHGFKAGKGAYRLISRRL